MSEAAGQKTGEGGADRGVGEEMDGAEEEFTDKEHESQFCLESNFIGEEEKEKEEKQDSQPPGEEEDAKGKFHGNAGHIIPTSLRLTFLKVLVIYLSQIHNIESHSCKKCERWRGCSSLKQNNMYSADIVCS